MMTPKLIPLKLPIEKDDKRITLNKKYLVKYDGRWAIDTFSKQWYGWNFNGIYDAGLQVDYDGWEAICKQEDQSHGQGKPMKLHELIARLKKYNPMADVDVVAHCKSYEFTICTGGGEGCTVEDAPEVSFYVDDLCSNEKANEDVPHG